MWTTITREDLGRVKAELTHSHFQTDIRHAEEREALRKRQENELHELDGRITKIEQLERHIEAFIKEYAASGETGSVEAGRVSPARQQQVEVVAAWAKTKFGFRAA